MLEQRSIPRFWDCSIPTCSNAAALDSGGCERCMRQYCGSHLRSPAHPCPVSKSHPSLRAHVEYTQTEPLDDRSWIEAQTRELESLRQKICDGALLRVASDCNRGLSCRLDNSDRLGRSLMGGMHIHLRIIFEDGTKWLARILRQNFTSFSDDISNSVIVSECATLKWLERVNIPTPKLHSYGLRNDPANRVNVAYMLIDEMTGTPFLHLNPSESQRQKVCDQLTEILSTLYRHPLDHIGCLTLSSDPVNNFSVGPIVSDRTGTLYKIGPFQCARQYYTDWAEHYLQLICDGQLYTAYPVEAYLIFKYLKILAEDGRWNPLGDDMDRGPFFMKHMDDKGDHLLVDQDFNITAIIDWTFARAVPVYEAFGPSLTTASLGDLLGGRPGLTEFDRQLSRSLEQRGSPLARFAAAPDIVRRLSFGLGMGMNLSWNEARCVFAGIQKTMGGDEVDFDWQEWRREHLQLWSDDARLRLLLQSCAV